MKKPSIWMYMDNDYNQMRSRIGISDQIPGLLTALEKRIWEDIKTHRADTNLFFQSTEERIWMVR